MTTNGKRAMDHVGTRWHKTDLHLHTASSACYAGEYTAKGLVDRALEQGLSCIAVTDHNTGAGIDAVKEAAKDTGLTVFPGVEVTCSDAKVHMLLLFDTDRTGQQVEDLLILLGLGREKFGGSDAHVQSAVHEVASKAHEAGAIVIPAHIDAHNGVSAITTQAKKFLFDLPFLRAVQVVHPELVDKDAPINEAVLAKMEERYGQPVPREQVKAWKSCASYLLGRSLLTFSDNPEREGSPKHGLWGVGHRYTWIKMGQVPSLASLRQALLMPEVRVLNCFQAPNEPPRLPATWLRRLSVSGSTIVDEGETFTVDFSPQLTTIIGGRGSGKSAILKFIRGTLGRTEDLIPIPALLGEFRQFFKKAEKGQGVLGPEATIELHVVHNDQLYRICRKPPIDNGMAVEVTRFDPEADRFVAAEGDYLALFPVDLYDQKQVYEIARSPSALRDQVDARIPACQKLASAIDAKRAEYLSTCTRARELQTRLRGEDVLRAEIGELQTRAASFRASGLEELIQQSQSFDREAQALKTTKALLEEQVITKFDALLTSLSEASSVHVGDQELHPEFRALVDGVRSRLAQVHNDLAAGKANVAEIARGLTSDLKDSAWQRQRAATTKEVMEKKGLVNGQGVGDIDAYQTLLSDLDRKQQELTRMAGMRQELLHLEAAKEAILTEIVARRREATRERKQFLGTILRGQNVRVEVLAFSDFAQYASDLRAILDRADSYGEGIQTLVGKLSEGKVLEALQRVRADVLAMRAKENVEGYDGRFRRLIRENLSDDKIDRILVLFPEDQLMAQYRPNATADFKNITNASAGQKTASILTFILSHGTSPLILDQPEDDLDNHLVYALIVDRLRAAKERRQVIIVTHNANIPVNGDAEYAIAMRSDTSTMGVLRAGTIDEPSIQREICDVMEGGEEAFGLRSARYGFSRSGLTPASSGS